MPLFVACILLFLIGFVATQRIFRRQFESESIGLSYIAGIFAGIISVVLLLFILEKFIPKHYEEQGRYPLVVNENNAPVLTKYKGTICVVYSSDNDTKYYKYDPKKVVYEGQNAYLSTGTYYYGVFTDSETRFIFPE